MKLNEALLIGGALLATLVLSKGGAASSNNTQFSGKSAFPVLPIENKAENQKIKLPTLEIFKQFFPVTDTNVQLKQIINIEEEKKNQRVSYLQNELSQTQNAIRGYERQLEKGTTTRGAAYYGIQPAYLYPSDVATIQEITKREKIEDQDIVNYYEALKSAGETTSNRKFPIVSFGLKAYYENILSSRENIKREAYADLQQEGINQVQEEYQTRFGSLSRYG